MDLTSIKFWVTQGALGIMCCLLLWAVIHLWRQLHKDRAEHKKDADDREARHRADLSALLDKYMVAWQHQITMYHQHAEKLSAAFAAVEIAIKRLERKKGV